MKKRSCGLLGMAIAGSLLLTAGLARAADRGPVLGCDVSITYTHTNAGTVFGTETYARRFTVSDGSPFVDDFSTVVRQKTFSATARTERGVTVVSIDLFNDVGVFSTVTFTAQATLVNGSGSTAGRQAYDSTLGVAGSHETRYQLACKRQ